MSQQSYKVKSAVLRGVEALPVEVEVLISSGIPSFSIVGMPDTAIQESRERVRAAIKPDQGSICPSRSRSLRQRVRSLLLIWKTRSWWVSSLLKEGFVLRQGSSRISNARANWAQRS